MVELISHYLLWIQSSLENASNSERAEYFEKHHFNFGSTTSWLCNYGQVTQPVSSSV